MISYIDFCTRFIQFVLVFRIMRKNGVLYTYISEYFSIDSRKNNLYHKFKNT